MLNNNEDSQVYLFPLFSRKKGGFSNSHSRQYESALRVAKKCNLQINEDLLVLDSDKSAINKMGKLGMFLHAVEEGKVASGSVLVIESLDQFRCESVSSAMELLNRLIQNDITIVTTSDGNTYDRTEMNERPGLMLYALTVMDRAFQESMTKRTRFASSLRHKIREHEEGKPTKFFTKVPHWISSTENGFVLNQNAKTIRIIVEMYLAQKGIKSIVRELAELGIKSPTGKEIWAVSTIRSILKNPALFGLKKFTIHSTNHRVADQSNYEIDDFYPPLIAQAEFIAIQGIAPRNSKNSVVSN
ncbi:recombinase family protein [Vibrio sp. HN007]|uniref:recombinase family protein n=1 Tax=Vibrio iocasae TaxID=3098914 RepID=UPI0035D4A95D